MILGTEDSGFRGKVSVLVDYIEFPKEASMQANVIERGNLHFGSTEGEIKKARICS